MDWKWRGSKSFYYDIQNIKKESKFIKVYIIREKTKWEIN